MSRMKTYNMVDVDPYLQSFIKARMSDKFEGLKMQKVMADIALEIRVKEFLEKVANENPQQRHEKWRRRRSVLLSQSGKNKTIEPQRERVSSLVSTSDSTVKRISIKPNNPPLHNGRFLTAERELSENSATDIKNEPAVITSEYTEKDNITKMPDIKGSHPVEEEMVIDGKNHEKHVCAENVRTLPELVKPRNKDLDSDTLWAGDPKAIGSIRRPRKNAEEMLAVFRSGEEARKLVREMILPCSKNCNKPDYVTEMERMYVELPSLIPAIRKARKDLKQARKGNADPVIFVATEVHSALTLAPFKIENIYDKLYYDKKLIVIAHKNTTDTRSS